ncbi:hypothetical protein [Calothrix sp. 336/3]|uniref:hypothetical protein n=1 Tax=Calothrix sp. 336/3 TaxID=1337936 RepID=UPI0004E3985E|nr:hypothetical protein [Calothrix sp. 336/3]AKG22395.1 armadillo-type fold-containing protein [Calothrix sp. 336/3]
MAQASSSWQQLINQFPRWVSPGFLPGGSKSRTWQRFRGPGGTLGLMTAFLAMALWNWQLLLASSVGIGTMVLTYSLQVQDWQRYLTDIQKTLHHPQRRLVLAVMGGSFACFSTYMAIAICLDSPSPWIGAGAILQGVATVIILVLLVWQIVNFYSTKEENNLDNVLSQLTDHQPLKRLLALRQIHKLVSRQHLGLSTQKIISQCLQMLLCREEEVLVQEAAFEVLQLLEPTAENRPSLGTPLKPLVTRNKQKISTEN